MRSQSALVSEAVSPSALSQLHLPKTCPHSRLHLRQCLPNTESDSCGINRQYGREIFARSCAADPRLPTSKNLISKVHNSWKKDHSSIHILFLCFTKVALVYLPWSSRLRLWIRQTVTASCRNSMNINSIPILSAYFNRNGPVLLTQMVTRLLSVNQLRYIPILEENTHMTSRCTVISSSRCKLFWRYCQISYLHRTQKNYWCH